MTIKNKKPNLSLLDTKLHERKSFSCGISSLDNFLKINASKEQKLGLSTCYILANEKQIIGYFTLSSSHIPKENLSLEVQKKLKSYEYCPTIILGRLAVDEKHQGQNYGGILLIEALRIAYQTSGHIGAMAVEVDPINQKAENFYKKYGFVSLDSDKMILMIKTIAELFNF